MSNVNDWPVVLVTGSNGGVGFCICKRLLIQLCSRQPPDALPQSFVTHYDPTTQPNITIPSCDGLTIIMACRSERRAEKAREQLYAFLDNHISKVKVAKDYDGHAELLRRNLKIEIEQVDLANLSTVFRCADRIQKKYRYVSHLILNAGDASFKGIDWVLCAKQLLTDFLSSVTTPRYYTHFMGEMTLDGLGWVWQTNFFGHFALVRMLEHQLLASAATPERSDSTLGPRVVWMSSLGASPDFFSMDDWQLKTTAHSYETVKYQIDLVATHLDQQALIQGRRAGPVIRHLIAQPGVSSTNFSAALAGPFLAIFKDVLLYIARLLGSPHHPIDPYKGAIPATHLILAPLTFLTFWITSPPSSKSKANPTNINGHVTNGNGAPTAHPDTGHWIRPPSRFGAETDRWGNARVGLTPVLEWESHQRDAKVLVEKCDELLMSIVERESEPIEIETASDRM